MRCRAAVVTVEATFVEITEAPDLLTFTDVPESAYYYDAVYWAVENGVTNGTSATFGHATVTHDQAVTFLWRSTRGPATTRIVSQRTIAAWCCQRQKILLNFFRRLFRFGPGSSPGI